MTTQAIWISYDLGIRGDYSSLYAWLDAHDAKECGESVAFLNYSYDGELRLALKNDLGKAVALDKGSRIYVVFRETKTNKNKGVFIFGGRKSSPWTGYAPKGAGTTEDEEL